MDKRTTVVAVLLLVVLVAAGVAYFRSGPKQDPQVAKALETQSKIAKVMIDGGSRKDRQKAFEDMRGEMKNLDENQRKQVFQEGMSNFARKFDERLKDYFDLPPEKRVAFLDKDIKRMEDMRKEAMAARANGEGPPRGPGGGGKGSLDGKSRDEFRRNMLNKTSPDQRARMTEYMQDLQRRRQQLGLPVMPIPF